MLTILSLSAGAAIAAHGEAVAPTAEQAKPPSITIDLPVDYDGAHLGDVVARVSGSDAAIKPDGLVAHLADHASPALLDSLAALPTDADGFAELSAFGEAGLALSYLPNLLRLRLDIDVADRGTRQVSIRSPISLDPASGLTPADFSLGMTLIARSALVHSDGGILGKREPFRGELLGFANLGGFEGWNLIWDLDLQEKGQPFDMREITLVKDDFDAATRLSVGDFRSASIGATKRSVEMFGVNFRRDYQAIQPFRTLRPRGRSLFILERPSRVMVEVDGIIVFDENLQPGNYDVRDFPFSSGSNEAKLTIDDGTGIPEVEYLSAFVDNELLAEGISRFDLGAGLYSNGRSRFGGKPAITGFYERGISDSLTLGAYSEWSGDLFVGGSRATLGTPIGLFTAEAALSRHAGQWGTSAILQYRTDFETGPWQHNVALQGEYSSSGFDTLGGSFGRSRNAYVRWSAYRDNLSLSLSATHNDGSQSKSQTLSGRVGLRLRGLPLSAQWQMRWRDTAPVQHRGLLSLTIPLGRQARLGARLDNRGGVRMDYRQTGGYAIGDSFMSAQASRMNGEVGLSGRARHITNRGEFEIEHVTRDGPTGRYSRSALTAAIGLGFADGAMQFGRPFDAGFIIIDRHPSLKGRLLEIREGPARAAGLSDAFGSAFVPLRSAYSRYGFEVEVDDLPPTYDLGDTVLEVVPGYRGGYRLMVGSDPTITAVGNLLLPAGTPVALKTGWIRSLSDPEAEAVRIFTNRTGRFVIEKIESGSYRVEVDGLPDLGALIAFDEDSEFVNLGTITLEKVQ